MKTINTYNFTGRDLVVSNLLAITPDAEAILDYILSIFDWHKSITLRLNAELLQAIIGKKYKAVLNVLSECSVIKNIHNYCQAGQISRGYKLIVDKKEKKGELENKFLNLLLNQMNNTGNMKVQRMKRDLANSYYEWAKCVTFSSMDDLNAQEIQSIERFNKTKGGHCKFSSKTGRMSTAINSMTKRLRDRILIDGAETVEIDSVASVYNVIYQLEYMMPNGLDAEFKNQIQHGDIYKYVQFKCNFSTRQEAKDALNMTLNASDSSFQHARTKSLFPKMFASIDAIKEATGGHQIISHIIQSAEAKAIFNISLTLASLDIKHFTIHDGILVKKSDAEYVRALMLSNNIKTTQK